MVWRRLPWYGEDYNGMEKANTKQTIILLQLEWCMLVINMFS